MRTLDFHSKKETNCRPRQLNFVKYIGLIGDKSDKKGSILNWLFHRSWSIIQVRETENLSISHIKHLNGILVVSCNIDVTARKSKINLATHDN